MEQFNPAPAFGFAEFHDENGIRIALLPMRRAPGLNNQAVGNNDEIPSTDHAVEGGPFCSNLATDSCLGAGRGSMILRVRVNFEKAFR